jgi:heme ABC exporter ATP-binding subunit CcmA
MHLACQGLTRSYGATRALSGVDLSAVPGEIVAVVGPNGAGKSTLIRILATLMRPDAGTYRLGDFDSRTHTSRLRAHIGYLGHESMLDSALTVRENLRLFSRLYGANGLRRAQSSRADALIDRFNAAAFADNPVTELSRGQEQTAALCRALLHDPALLLLDEPTAGLDAAAQQRLWETAKAHASAGRIVIFTTHDLAAADQVAHRRVQLKEGRII